jgi:mRNA interferase MazF
MAVVKSPRRFEIFLVSLDPSYGSEIKKTRPCLVISPEEMNKHLNTVIVAPMTTKSRSYPSRIPTDLQGKPGEIVLDQLRTVDKRRLIKRLAQLDEALSRKICNTLTEMFAF